MKTRTSTQKKKQHQKKRPLFIIIGITLLGLSLALYSFYFSSDENDRDKAIVVKTDSLQAELAKCDEQATQYNWEISKRRSCLQFIKQQCEVLKANYALTEKKTVADQDLGRRLPVLKPSEDPFYPLDCVRQWFLSEPELFESNPKSFSEFPFFYEHSPQYFAHKDKEGNLQFPEKYEIEKKYSQRDQELLKKTLQAAYKYADVNVAIRDGYVPQPGFDKSMGIHFQKLSLYDGTIDIDQPEFLTYIKSRWNNSYVLAQVGYIHIKQNNFKKYHHALFKTYEAKGHNHFLACFYVDEYDWFKQISMTNNEPIKEDEALNMFVGFKDEWILMPFADAMTFYNGEKEWMHESPYKIGCFDSIWMIHVAVNLYNENGLFTDKFPLIDTMTQTGEIYSFFGKKFDIRDYELPISQ